MVLVDMASCKRIIYTLGTDRRTEEDFIEILNAYGIELLIDVRRFPTSKFQHFRREDLERLLKANKIGYIFMGNELGGYRKGGYGHLSRVLCLGVEFSVKYLSQFISIGLKNRHWISPSTLQEPFPLQKQIYLKYFH